MIVIDHSKCILCGGCASVCPKGAIVWEGTRMKIYPEKCVDCGLCLRACPANAIKLFKGIKDIKDLPKDERKKV